MSASQQVSLSENDLKNLAAACAGDTQAFNALVEPHRNPLLVHCYRLSGSLDDAEDLVQETFVRAWNKVDSYKQKGAFRNWLYVIASRLWLDEVRKRKKQVLLPLDGSPADPDSPPLPPTGSAVWLDPLPNSWLTSVETSPESSYERQETISLAFMVALQKLNASQRVVLILRQVFNWRAEEVADALGITVASVNNHLYRARKMLIGAEYEEGVAPKKALDNFVQAWEAGDVPALINLLHDKATFAMPPMGVWYVGPATIGQALQNFVFRPDVTWKLVLTIANGRPAFGIYQAAAGMQSYQPFGLILPIFSAENNRVIEITAFLSPHLVKRFDLPEINL
ncbi:MAG: RNA polymerase subunit sigma-70 [Chloroflexota bacterium]